MARVWRSGITIVTQPDGSRLSVKFINIFSMTNISHSWYELHTGESMTFPAQTILNLLGWRSCYIGIKYILQSVFAVSVYTKYAVPCYCTLAQCIKRWYEYLALMFINYWGCIILICLQVKCVCCWGFHVCIISSLPVCRWCFFFSRFTEVCLCIATGELLVIFCNSKLGAWCCSSRSCTLS